MSKNDKPVGTLSVQSVASIPPRSGGGKRYVHDAAARGIVESAIKEQTTKAVAPLTRNEATGLLNFLKRLRKTEPGYAGLELACRQFGDAFTVYVGPGLAA